MIYVEIIESHKKEEAEYRAEIKIGLGYEVSGFSSCVQLGGDIIYTILMVKNDSHP